MSSTTRPIVFMDINIGETPAGRIKMELFSDIVPKCATATRLGPCTILITLTGLLRTSGSYAPVNAGKSRPVQKTPLLHKFSGIRRDQRPQGYKNATFHR